MSSVRYWDKLFIYNVTNYYRKLAKAGSLDDEGNDKDATFAGGKEQDTEVT